ncbi:LptF/LptG family permease [Corallibacter sp.]|uniref:LptF/LptG family permease n=1 Tax=Corallibacter sp. TaxID=2038084 RepID=UPI003A942EA0
MKILDRYILTSYLKTFISVFVILMLIFVLQTIWLYIKELAGKDLDILVVAKFLLYFSPKLIPLVLPLTILLASIMVFGSFAENYEFAAMKSTGISLQRAMTGLSIFILGLAIVTFFFSNNVIPWAEYNSYNLRKNIAKLKPAMVIAEGQFNEIGNKYNIKVAKKSGDRGQFLEDVIIHEKSGSTQGNHTVIISKTGELIGEESSDVLKLILYNGYFYDDTPPKDFKDREKRPMKKSAFDKYVINIDLSEYNVNDLEEKNISDKYNMLNISDLNYSIDSLKVDLKNDYNQLTTNLYNRTNLPVLNHGVNTTKKDTNKKKTDSLSQDKDYNGAVLDLFATSKKVQIINLAINSVKSSKQIINSKGVFLKFKSVSLNKHIIALHEKLALGFACIILFFVGAPLGALIRKGGIGLPMVIAILLFLTYHFIGIFAKNSASDGSINPALAAWFSTLIMLPLGIFLTRRATADRGLFEFDHITEPLKKLFNKKANSEDDRISKEDLPESVVNVLKQKNHFTEKNVLDEQQTTESKEILKDYNEYARFTLIFYIAGAILLPLYFILKNNKLPEIAVVCLQLSIIAFSLMLVYYIVSFLQTIKIYKILPQKGVSKNPIWLILGAALYPLAHIINRNKLTADLSNSSK